MAEINFIGNLKLKSNGEIFITAAMALALIIFYILFIISISHSGFSSTTIKLLLFDIVITAIPLLAIKEEISQQREPGEQSEES